MNLNRSDSLPSQSQPALEGLEARMLLSATLIKGELLVEGTGRNDVIQVNLSEGKYTIRQGRTKSGFPARRVKAISVATHAGNDRITVLTRLSAKLTIDGGDGNDSLTGGAAAEILKGGSGDDLIAAGGGNDRVFGDAGSDALYGDAGNDSVYGGDGNDVLAGDDEDLLYAAAVHAHVTGRDLLDGGGGDDWLLGGTGNQSIHDPNGIDTLTGGAGADVLDARGGDDALSDAGAQDFVPSRDAVPGRERPGDVHTHADIQIRVRQPGGEDAIVFIPAMIGHFASVFSGLHTHVDSNKAEDDKPANFSRLHYEAPAGTPGYTLRDFFRLWGISFSKTHVGRLFASSDRTIRMTVNGQNNSSFENYPPRDGDQIVIRIG